TVLLGGDSVTLNLTKATDLRITRSDSAAEISCSVVVHRAGREVARVTRMLPVLDAGTTSAGTPATGGIRKPASAENVITRTLPGDVADVAVGGGGRFLLLHMPGLKKLAVFDINETKVVRYLDVAEAGAKIAAGQDMVLAALPGSDRIQRWSLKTLELET